MYDTSYTYYDGDEGVYFQYLVSTTLNMIFSVTAVIFRMTPLVKKWTNTVVDDGWVHPLAKPLPSSVCNLWWNIVMDAWNLDEKSLGKWS